jgi:AcrR family transcriptional regulator
MTRIGQHLTRRQPRGERRIEQILDAAMSVFAKVGYARATTNAIAAEAGISPGSLYQFFGNKDEIAEALEKRYAELIARAREDELSPDPAAPFDLRLARLLDGVVAIACGAPGFNALFAERPYSADVAQAAHAHHAAVVGQLEAIVATRAPQMAKADRARITQVATQITRALMPSIVAAQGAERARLVAELKTAVTSYLDARVAAATA